MKSHPQISVLTIVYNGERYIREAVDSILNQTYRDFEYILVDNNSTDDTPKILADYAQKDKRIRIIKEAKQGILYARNAGLQVAKGKWVAVLDADDIAFPGRLETQLDFVQKNPDVVLVGSGCIMIGPDGQFLKSYSYPIDHESLVSRLEKQQAYFPHSSAFCKREVVEKLNRYRFSAAEDYDLWLRLTMEGKIACIKEPLIKLRRHVQSNSYSTDQEYYLLCKVVPLVCYFRKKMGLSDLFGQQEKWESFLEWTKAQMESFDCFEKGKAQREFFRIWYSRDKSKLYRLTQMLYQFLSNRFTRAFLLDRSYLKNAAVQIAQESKVLF